MKLLTLKLRNFMGIKDFILHAGGNNVSVYGANGAGKTTLFSAFTWLLYDKDSANKKDFDIKTLDADGQVIHGLEHEVEAILEVDGHELALSKVYKEQWTKKRGSVSREFTGHTTDHYIDGVPVPKKDFTARISEISAEDVFKLLTSPTYFNTQLHWQDRREILLEVCGDISDADVIASDKALAKLPDILKGRKLDDHRKVINERRKAINDELEKIPVRIDEIERGLPDISSIQADKLPDDIAKLRKKAREKEQEIITIQNGGAIAEKKREISIIGTELQELRNSHREMLDGKVGDKREDLNLIREAILDHKGDIDVYSRSIRMSESQAKDLDAKMEALRSSWHEENNKVFSFEQDHTCPTCGQALPQEKLQEARDTARAAFNTTKAKKLESINAEGVTLKGKKTELETAKDESQQKLDKATADMAELEKKEAALRKEIDSILEGAEPVESTPEYKALVEKKDALQQEIKELEEGNTSSIAGIQQEIDDLECAIVALEKNAAQVEQHEKGTERIEQLKKQEKDLAAEFEALENELYLTEQFIRTKVALLEEKINSKFKLARFKLFNVLVNGGVEECCETLCQGVPYSSGLNNAARINVGLDIINTLADHYGFDAPIFVDNAEAVTDLIETRGQQIRLIVSKKDKKLRVETAASPQTLFDEREAV